MLASSEDHTSHTSLKDDNDTAKKPCMNQVQVEINQRPFGVRFGSSDALIHSVQSQSVAWSVGLAIGDKLVAIKGNDVTGMKASAAISLFRREPLPFTATFLTAAQGVDVDDDDDYHLSLMHARHCDVSESSSLSSVSPKQSVSGFDPLREPSCEVDADADTDTEDGIDDEAKEEWLLQDFETDVIDELQLGGRIKRISGSGTARNPQAYVVHAHGQQATSKKSQSPFFDVLAVTQSNGKRCVLDSRGFQAGEHFTWYVEILRSSAELQEVGVMATPEIKCLSMADSGVAGTKEMSARSVYGSDMGADSVYYGSWNDDGSTRCLRELSREQYRPWCSGDTISVELDCTRWRIRFALNGSRIRNWCVLLLFCS